MAPWSSIRSTGSTDAATNAPCTPNLPKGSHRSHTPTLQEITTPRAVTPACSTSCRAITNYRTAIEQAHSLTYRVIEGAVHVLSDEPWQPAYTLLLVTWAAEMVLGAREGGTASATHTHLVLSPRVADPG